jgi:hypothetical protein
MLQHAFTQLACIRVEFETDEENIRSRRALEALPAHFEGILRNWRILANGRRRSSALYSILDDEWPDVRSNLERRLDQRDTDHGGSGPDRRRPGSRRRAAKFGMTEAPRA